MIDLHNHILPGVDDGSADVEESIEIARQFVSEGVQRVTATPHFDPLRRGGVTAAEARELIAQVQSALDRAGVPLQVLPGHELFLTPEAGDLLAKGTVSTLGGTSFVLVEVSLAAVERPLYLDDALFHLQLQGFRPILAHPERYAFVQRDVSSVDNLAAAGVSLQLTAPALLGEYGGTVKRTATKLLERGSYSLAASDRHHPGARRSLSTLYDRLCELQGDDELAELLLKVNPARVLDGRDPHVPEPLPGKASLFGRLFRSKG